MSEYKLLQTQEGSETWDRYGNVTQFDLKCYIIGGELSKRDAMQIVWDAAPADYQGLFKSSIKFDGYDEDRNAEFTVSYNSTSQNTSGETNNDVEISFSTGGGTKHVVSAIKPNVVYGKNECGNLIGWNGKKGVEAEYAGADVPDSNSQLSLTVTKRMSELNNKWQRNVDAATGKVNSGKFRGYEPGEVMFNGVSLTGSEKSKSVKVTYNFSIRLNENNVPIATDENGEIITVSKKGFEYAWVAHQYSSKHKRNIPTLVRVDQVVETADFSKLGI